MNDKGIHSFSVEYRNFFSLKEALDEDNTEIDGICIDHYQYLHYLKVFPRDEYKIVLHASHGIAVGILVSGAIVEDNASEIAGGPAWTQQVLPIIDCLTRHALLAKLTLDQELIGSLNHSAEINEIEPPSKTVEAFFGKEVLYMLVGGALLLCLTLIIYGLIDEFIIRKFAEIRVLKDKNRTPYKLTKGVEMEIRDGCDELSSIASKNLKEDGNG